MKTLILIVVVALSTYPSKASPFGSWPIDYNYVIINGPSAASTVAETKNGSESTSATSTVAETKNGTESTSTATGGTLKSTAGSQVIAGPTAAASVTVTNATTTTAAAQGGSIIVSKVHPVYPWAHHYPISYHGHHWTAPWWGPHLGW